MPLLGELRRVPPPILTTSPDRHPNTEIQMPAGHGRHPHPPVRTGGEIHLGPEHYYVARDATPEMNIALQDKLGFSNAVIVSGGAYGRNYTHLSDTLTRFPDRFRGVALIPDDLERRRVRAPRKLGRARHAPVQRVARRRAADHLGADRGARA